MSNYIEWRNISSALFSLSCLNPIKSNIKFKRQSVQHKQMEKCKDEEIIIFDSFLAIFSSDLRFPRQLGLQDSLDPIDHLRLLLRIALL